MKMIKRTMTSIKRKPYQMILIFIIVFVLGNVLFASIAVRQSSENVKTEMRKRVPTTMDIEYDRSIFHEVDYDSMMLFLEELKKDSDIESINTLLKVDVIGTFENINFWNKDSYIGFDSINDKRLKFKIVDGRNYKIDDFESDIPKIVIPYGVGKVGEIYRIPIWDYQVTEIPEGKEYSFPSRIVKKYLEFEIIGTYDIEHWVKANRDHGIPLYNQWITEMRSQFLKLMAQHSEEDKKAMEYDYLAFDAMFGARPNVESIHLNVNGMDAIERLEKEIRDYPNFDRYSYTIKTSSEDYRYIQAPLENLVALANVAMWASAFLTISLLSLVSILFLRNRKHEIGILMALGERKIKVLGQFVCEILLVGLLATSCSMISGSELGAVLSNEFMKIQIDVDSELQYEKENNDAITQLDMIDVYEVKMDMKYIATIYVSAILILLISSGLPVGYILKMKPTEVLM